MVYGLVPMAILCMCGTRTFDVALHNILSRVDALASVKLAVQSEFASLDESFLPELAARLEEAPSERLWAVQDTLGELLSRPELVRRTAVDDIITRHWRNVDNFWDLSEQEARAVDMDGLPEGSTAPDGRASAYGEVTRTGARALFLAMGLAADGPGARADAAVFFDLGSGAGRLVAQAWLELAPTGALRRAVGVELAPTRHAAAQSAWNSLVAAGHATRGAPAARAADGPEFVLGSFLECDLSEATHVYVCSKLFGDELLNALWARLCDERQAPRLEAIAFVERVPSAAQRGMPPHVVVPVAMNWSDACRVFVYRFRH